MGDGMGYEQCPPPGHLFPLCRILYEKEKEKEKESKRKRKDEMICGEGEGKKKKKARKLGSRRKKASFSPMYVVGYF